MPASLDRSYFNTAQKRSPKICSLSLVTANLKEGDVVIIDVFEQQNKGDAHYVIKMGPGLYLKRIQVLRSHKCLIISDISVYHNFETRLDEIEVLGKVVNSLRLGSS